jgi:hypothetical protein
MIRCRDFEEGMMSELQIDVARTRANEEGRAQIAAWLEECRRGESDRLAEALDVASAKTTLRPIEVMEMFKSARQIAEKAKAEAKAEPEYAPMKRRSSRRTLWPPPLYPRYHL